MCQTKNFLSLKDFLTSKYFGDSQDHDPHKKKVDIERQQAKGKSKESMEEIVSTHANAIADLRAEVENVISRLKSL